MKRLLVVMMIIPLILCGCKNKSDKFTVTVNMDCDDVYGVHIEYFLGGDAMGGIVVGLTEGALPRGENISFKFDSNNFKNAYELHTKPFQIMFAAVMENGEEIPISAPENRTDNADYKLIGESTDCYWEWSAAFSERYEFTLESDKNGYFIYPTH